MNTLIIPCAGKSNRFPDMKPKWLLTHPDGDLMIEKAFNGLNLEIFDRIIITIVKPHDKTYDAGLILSQVFKNNHKIEICILDDFTSCSSETVFLTLEKMNVKGAFVIKDADNCVKVNIPNPIPNSVTGYDIHKHPDISNIPSKSFLIVNEQNIIEDIIEKRVVSNVICLGVYTFEDVELFKKSYKNLLAENIKGEMYVSHVISYILSAKKHIFISLDADDYDDWGTLTEWHEVQKRYRTYFIDVDGVIIKNCGKYGKINWYNNEEIIEENAEVIRQLQDRGAQIIITTSREDELKNDLEKILNKNGIYPYAVLTGLNHSARVIVNDFASTNPYPSGIAVTLPRNGLIKEYIE